MNVGELIKELEKYDKNEKIFGRVELERFGMCNFSWVDIYAIKHKDDGIVIECIGR